MVTGPTSPETDESDTEPPDTYQSLNVERERDLGGCPWEEYLLYVLEVDKEDVNTDGLREISDVFRAVEPTTEHCENKEVSKDE